MHVFWYIFFTECITDNFKLNEIFFGFQNSKFKKVFKYQWDIHGLHECKWVLVRWPPLWKIEQVKSKAFLLRFTWKQTDGNDMPIHHGSQKSNQSRSSCHFLHTKNRLGRRVISMTLSSTLGWACHFKRFFLSLFCTQYTWKHDTTIHNRTSKSPQ